jgi:hypothetical protein
VCLVGNLDALEYFHSLNQTHFKAENKGKKMLNTDPMVNEVNY